MRFWSKKRISILLGISIIGASIGLSFWYYRYSTARLYDFVNQRDRAEILEIFDHNWYWLIPGDRATFSPELMMDYKAPRQNIMYAGRLTIKVLRKCGEFIGFVAYYMKSPEHGFLNLIAIKPEFRGKGYSIQMAQYAVDDMINRGAKKLTGQTRHANVQSRAMFKHLGFHEVGYDDIFVFFERKV